MGVGDCTVFIISLISSIKDSVSPFRLRVLLDMGLVFFLLKKFIGEDVRFSDSSAI